MANTKVVIDLEVTDKGLVATFNKTTKALVTLNEAQKEKLNLQKKQKAAGTKYLASLEEESKQIVRINKETAELATPSLTVFFEDCICLMAVSSACLAASLIRSTFFLYSIPSLDAQ